MILAETITKPGNKGRKFAGCWLGVGRALGEVVVAFSFRLQLNILTKEQKNYDTENSVILFGVGGMRHGTLLYVSGR